MAIYNHIVKLISRVTPLVALLFFAACANENSEPTPELVTFDISDSQDWRDVTRGAALTQTTLCDRGFGVFAYYTEDKAWSAYNKPEIPNFINNSKVTSANNGASWGYSPVKYWPATQGHKISFFAYAPHDPSQKVVENTKIDFTVADDVKDHIDLVWSNENTIDKTKDNGGINFTFKHALARIGFSVKASANGTSALPGGANAFRKVTIKINEIRIGDGDGNGFKNKGRLDLNNTKTTPEWGNKDGNKAYKLHTDDHYNANRTLTTENSSETMEIAGKETRVPKAVRVNNDNAYIMVIPQDFSNSTSGLKVYVKYTVELSSRPNTTANFSPYLTYTNECTGSVNINLEASKTYIFNIKTDMETASVDGEVTITEWDEDGGSVWIPAFDINGSGIDQQ